MAQMLGFDEYGRPFLVLNDQENQKRLTGLKALKVKPRPESQTLRTPHFPSFIISVVMEVLIFQIADKK